MRVLRSQYMELQESVTLTTTTLTTNKELPNASPSALNLSATPTCLKNIVQTKTASIDVVHNTAANQGAMRNNFQIPMDAIRISANPLQPIQTLKRRKTMTNLQTPPKPNNFNIKLLNTHCQTGVVKLVLHFYNEGPKWYTQLCRSYEGQLWKRLPRLVPTKKSKWLYLCHLCSRSLSCFDTMKSHLNNHLGLRPHRCAECIKKYPSRNSLVRHHKQTTHKMQSLKMGVTQPMNVQSL